MTTGSIPFLKLLLSCGIIDSAAAARFGQIVFDEAIHLGRILLERQWLSMREVAQVLAYQADNPRALFGQIAVHLGHCSQEQIDAACAEQRERTPHAMDMAWNEPGVDKEKLYGALVTYIRDLEAKVFELSHSNSIDGPAAPMVTSPTDSQSEAPA